MQVKVVHELLVPCVEHGDEAELATETPLWIAGKDLQCFFDCSKQECQHYLLICQNKRVEFVGYGEDVVKI